MTLDDLWGLHKVDILEKYVNGQAFKKIYRWKRWFWNFKMTLCDLYWFLKSFFMYGNICVFILLEFIEIHRNRFINENAKRKEKKISKSWSISVRYRRTYVLNKDMHDFTNIKALLKHIFTISNCNPL